MNTESDLNPENVLFHRELESSPCPTCKEIIMWGWEYCPFCGKINPHYDVDFKRPHDDFPR